MRCISAEQYEAWYQTHVLERQNSETFTCIASQSLLWHRLGYFAGFGAVLAVLYSVPESVLMVRDRPTDTTSRDVTLEFFLWAAVVSSANAMRMRGRWSIGTIMIRMIYMR